MNLARSIVAAGLASLAMGIGSVAAAPTPKAVVPAPTQAVEPAAVQALQKMSGYLSTLSTFELTSHTSLDLVTVDGEKLQFDGTARYKARRPDGLTLEVTSDLKNRRYYYDGKTFTIFAPEAGFYATVPAQATIRQTLDALYAKYGFALPLEDLFRWSDPSHPGEKRLTSAWDVGPAKVDGVDVEQYAFREGDIDFQVWIQAGDKPLPLKVMIVDRTDPADPAYVARLSWTLNPNLSADDFAFHPPKDAKPIRIGAVVR